MTRTADDVSAALPSPGVPRLEAPPYTGTGEGARVGLAVESMRSHMTDEGAQLFDGLEHAGYALAGHNLPINETDVPTILERTGAAIAVVQDVREWRLALRDFRDPAAEFRNAGVLRERPDVFKLTILKDAHQRPAYHADNAREMGVHAHIVYYHPRIVQRLAPYIRPEHVVRTYHTVNADLVPPFAARRGGCLLSGAISGAYPLRNALVRGRHLLPQTSYLPHPGYHRRGCHTPQFLKSLSTFRVAICTSSVFGYALRKLIEATACGCRVITDLPTDEVLPEIDSNLERVPSTASVADVGRLVQRLCAEYDAARQEELARRALRYFDYRAAGLRLAAQIEDLRRAYP